ncbi:MAG: Origin recognition complex subunit 2 [Vezdaea aestivalis]|nr:MAG: Origin recognition complex subunit 2 [Vezdaea aestivalis]
MARRIQKPTSTPAAQTPNDTPERLPQPNFRPAVTSKASPTPPLPMDVSPSPPPFQPSLAAQFSASPPSQQRRHRRSPPALPPSAPPQDQYFHAHRPGGTKTSNRSLDPSLIMERDAYNEQALRWQERHAPERRWLEDMHASGFAQWAFEMQEGFSVCLYGWGSKRRITRRFAEWSWERDKSEPIVVVNAHAPSLTTSSILHTLNTALHDPPLILSSSDPLTLLLAPNVAHITLLIPSLDALPLRRPAMQLFLSRLASHPKISLLATVDTPDFGLLWDSSLRSAFNWAFHDVTTFEPFAGAEKGEGEAGVVGVVHELLGRKGRREGGVEGVKFVLRSLPENARRLFEVLVREQRAAEEGAVEGEEELGVEYVMLLEKATEEFICNGEAGFRALLKEFVDHELVRARRDMSGGEMLWVPFKGEELRALEGEEDEF